MTVCRMRWLALGAVVALGFGAPACGGGDSSDPQGGGGSGGTGTGGTGLDGGIDGFVGPDGSEGGFDPDSDTCAWDSKKPERAGVDIIFVVDNSHSMGDEIQKTLANINTFADTIASSGVDYQVIMLSAKGTNLTDVSEDVPNLKGSGLTGDMPLEVCVPAPLGVGPGGADPCGDNDPRFHHLDNFPFGIASHNGMWLAIGMYNKNYTWADDSGPEGGGWAKWARFNATKYFVMITDDDAYVPGPNEGDPAIIGNATEPWEVFDRLILNEPRFGPAGMFGTEAKRKYVYNTVCGWTYPGGESTTPQEGGGCRTAVGDPSPNFAMSPGLQHQKLAQLTGGIVESICRSDWSAVLDKLADNLITAIGCEFELPTPSEGILEPNKVLVQHTPEGGSPEPLTRVTDESKCDQYPDGWYYDDNTAPTRIILCPGACSTIGAADTGQLDVLMGCQGPAPK